MTNYVMDSHFREPFPVGDKKFVYLSSHRNHDKERMKEGARQVDFGVFLDSTWLSDIRESTPSYTPNYFEPLKMDKKFKLPPDIKSAWEPAKASVIPGVYLNWPDRQAIPLFRMEPLLEWLSGLLDQDVKFEIGCIGGHGRTGTLAACLLCYRLGGKIPATEAISMVRTAYCKEAIESWEQIELIFKVNGEEPPKKPQAPSMFRKDKNDVKHHNTGAIYPHGSVMHNQGDIRHWLDRGPIIEKLGLHWEETRKGVSTEQVTQTALIVPGMQDFAYPPMEWGLE